MNILTWIAGLFGMRGSDIAGIRHVSLRLPSGSALPAILAGVILVGGLIAIVSYVRTTEPIRRRKRLVFACVRLLVYLLLAAFLSGLVLDVELATAEKPRALVLVDNTLSMTAQTSGQAGGQAPVSRMEHVRDTLRRSLGDLQRKRSVRLRLLDGATIREADLAELEATATRTDIPSALNAVLRDGTAAGLSEIVLFTDGRNTVAANYKTASVALRERGVRLYPLIVGEARDFKDVGIGAVRTAPYCRAFDRIVIAYTIHHQECAGARAKVEVFDADKPERILANAEHVLTASPAGQHGVLALDPPVRSGVVRLVVRVSGVAEDMVEGNNQATLHTLIVNEPIKVLYVDSFPRPEFRHVKMSLGQDPNIALTALNRMPGGSWLLQGPSLLENPEKGFPVEIGELLKYDVLVLGSISHGYFSADDRFEERKLNNIARFVSGRGGGLIVLGGVRSYGHGQYQGSPLEPLFPFELLEPGKEPF
ncbi:MAG: hypothetical protein GX548_06095, partial [Lentisphaerae bacterium]|nr:hypothetical protein [Lentisphaerota bacterium]